MDLYNVFYSHFLAHFVMITVIFFSNLESYQIGITTHTKYIGDREVAWRMKIAAERLGWTVLMDIYLDPENALEMAKRAHQIFTKKFTMENQLLKLEAMHKKVMSNREKSSNMIGNIR